MPNPKFKTIAEQVASHLHDEILRGRWSETMPGMNHLAPELGVNAKTVEVALQLLEKRGLLEAQGRGRRRRIVLSEAMASTTRALRVMILLYEESDRGESYVTDLLHRLRDAGHEAIFAEKTIRDMGMKVSRIAKFAEQSSVDAWVVMAGSRDILDWFAQQSIPAFAMFGRNSKTSLPGISLFKADAMTKLADQLVNFGHKRIVILAREERRKPNPGFLEQLFLDRLEEHGIKTGTYNLPDWGDSPTELREVCDSLFKYTPPTALIVDQPSLCNAVLQHLSRLRISAPHDVSLAFTDMEDSFHWCEPQITHITWDPRPVINRVTKWAKNISHGKTDTRKNTSKANLVLGGTIGPAPK